MPAPKAVLADITDKGLSPNKPHRFIGADGRLKMKTSPDVVQDEPKPVSPPAPKPVIAPEPVVEETSNEQLVEIPFVTIPDDQWADVEEEISKPLKPGLVSFDGFKPVVKPTTKPIVDRVIVPTKKIVAPAKKVTPKRKTKKKTPVKRTPRKNEDS